VGSKQATRAVYIRCLWSAATFATMGGTRNTTSLYSRGVPFVVAVPLEVRGSTNEAQVPSVGRVYRVSGGGAGRGRRMATSTSCRSADYP